MTTPLTHQRSYDKVPLQKLHEEVIRDVIAESGGGLPDWMGTPSDDSSSFGWGNQHSLISPNEDALVVWEFGENALARLAVGSGPDGNQFVSLSADDQGASVYVEDNTANGYAALYATEDGVTIRAKAIADQTNPLLDLKREDNTSVVNVASGMRGVWNDGFPQPIVIDNGWEVDETSTELQTTWYARSPNTGKEESAYAYVDVYGESSWSYANFGLRVASEDLPDNQAPSMQLYVDKGISSFTLTTGLDQANNAIDLRTIDNNNWFTLNPSTKMLKLGTHQVSGRGRHQFEENADHGARAFLSAAFIGGGDDLQYYALQTIRDPLGVFKVGFFSTPPVVKPTGVPVTAAGVHAALVSLGLIAA